MLNTFQAKSRSRRGPKQESHPTSHTYEIQHIHEVLSYIDNDTAVAWDIDNTLYEPANSFFPGDEWFEHQIELYRAQGHDLPEAVKRTLPLYNDAQHKTQVKACESDVVDIIRALQKRKIVNFALTSRGNEVYQATHDQLESIGISFDQGLFKNKSFEIEPDKFRDVKEGVVFCAGGRAKGDCLKATFKKLGWQPKKLVFIDDKAPYIASVKEACEELGIDFVGLRYAFMDEKKELMDKDILAIQKEIFENPIISDEEAMVLLQARNKIKCGMVPNFDESYGLIWCAGDEKEVYDKILDLDPHMKRLYRQDAKYFDVKGDGRELLCSRFIVPFEKLQQLLPKMHQVGILEKERCDRHLTEIQQGLMRQNGQSAAAVQPSHLEGEEKHQPKVVTQFSDYRSRLRDRTTLKSPFAQDEPKGKLNKRFG